MKTGEWLFNIPNTPSGKAALAVFKHGLNRNYSIRAYRRPVQGFGRCNKRKPVQHYAIYLYAKMQVVKYYVECPNCGGRNQHTSRTQRLLTTKQCMCCLNGRVIKERMEKLGLTRMVSLPQKWED